MRKSYGSRCQFDLPFSNRINLGCRVPIVLRRVLIELSTLPFFVNTTNAAHLGG